MKVKLTNEEILNKFQGVREFSNMTLPTMTALKVTKNIKPITAAIEDYETVRKKLLTQYGTEDEKKKGTYNIKEENQEAFNKELKEILKAEVSLEIQKFKVTENFPNIKPSVMMAIEFMVE